MTGGNATSAWERQARADADAILARMRTEVVTDPARTFSIAEMHKALLLSRARVAAGLTLLVVVDGSVGVTNERVDQARFYPVKK